MNDIRNNPGGTPPSRSFRLDKNNAKLAGVCSGIGNYFNIDPLLVRIAFVIALLLGFGAPVLVYIAIALIAD
jgi:phage shock protein PspC (stress-responsive transcriptional regulator)